MPSRLFKPRSNEQKALNDLLKLLTTYQDHRTALKNQYDSIQTVAGRKEAEKWLNTLDKQIKSIEKKLDELTEQNALFKQQKELMMSIKGVGCKTAYMLLARLIDINDFENAKQFAAYIGCTPKQHQSGKYIGKSYLSCIGDSRIRKALYMAAIVAKKHNEHLNRFVGGLEAKGKAPKSIICAVMRKLAHWIFGILKHQRMFEPQYV